MVQESSVSEEKKEEVVSMSTILEAVRELTKQMGELKAEWEKWRKAGKF